MEQARHYLAALDPDIAFLPGGGPAPVGPRAGTLAWHPIIRQWGLAIVAKPHLALDTSPLGDLTVAQRDVHPLIATVSLSLVGRGVGPCDPVMPVCPGPR